MKDYQAGKENYTIIPAISTIDISEGFGSVYEASCVACLACRNCQTCICVGPCRAIEPRLEERSEKETEKLFSLVA